MPKLPLRALLIVAAACVGAIGVLAVQAPARLIASAARNWSNAHVLLTETTGTIWDGQADCVLASADSVTALHTRLPGRLAWHINPWRLLVGAVDLRVSDDAVLDAPLIMRFEGRASGTIESGLMRLPAAALAGLGAPWNTIRPGGALVLEWDTLHLSDRALHGALRLQWLEASSSLTPVAPFGSYRLQADGIFDGARLVLETLSGPMELMGNGTIAQNLQLHFQGRARVRAGTDEAIATQLSGLVSLLGRSDGTGAILSFGT